MNQDRRSFLRVAGSSVLVGAGSAMTQSTAAAAQAPAPQAQPAPVSFPNVPNPLEGPVEVIASGYIWTEGPVWVGGADGTLLFSDVPGNAIYGWDGKRTTPFLAPSGYQGFPIPATLREAGSNGLALGRGGLLIADSGTRAIARVDLATRQRTVIAETFQGKRFNSPNDLVLARNGDIYFTDPAFGLTNTVKSTLRELTYTGVFRLTPNNQVHLIADNLSPNGVALSPDNRTLYATDNSGWVAIDLDASGAATGQRPFVRTESVGGARGDGMKADSAGNIWTSGRGGIYVFSPKGEHIGFAPIAGRVSNCCFGPGRAIYVSNDTQMVRGRIRADFPGGLPIA
jgi:gluconolactonase